MKLLHIIATPRGEKSRTLSISREFLDTMQKKYPRADVEELNLFDVDLPAVSGDTVDAKYVLMSGGVLDDATQESWKRIADYATEFLSFDIYLITVPMWNFSVPYQLKHYIDVIMQAGFLFRFTESGAEGLAKNKKMICITSRGSDYSPGSPINALDYQEPYLRTVFSLAGIEDITFFNAQPLDFAPGITKTKLQEVKEKAKQLAQSLDFFE
ncbi:MAG: NAD(P)H-dependent oxidoreductase [Anaerolineales bacterium]|nr:NAD(P)H-dependent oxidoreductase [Anaerolineales bacterium]